MKIYNGKITKANIINYFTQSGITIEVFANVLGVSKRWLEYLFSKNDNYEFDPNTVQKACDFFLTDFGKFTTDIQDVPNNLREILKKKHARNTEYSKILSDSPSTPFIIENVLLKDPEFTESSQMELKNIKKIIRRYFPDLKLTNLSKDLQNSKSLEFYPHPTKKNTNLYKKSNSII